MSCNRVIKEEIRVNPKPLICLESPGCQLDPLGWTFSCTMDFSEKPFGTTKRQIQNANPLNGHAARWNAGKNPSESGEKSRETGQSDSSEDTEASAKSDSGKITTFIMRPSSPVEPFRVDKRQPSSATCRTVGKGSHPNRETCASGVHGHGADQ